MVFCNGAGHSYHLTDVIVTILILIDGFLQYWKVEKMFYVKQGHNPYFNRWFSAMRNLFYVNCFYVSHNPYFNRWFSAIKHKTKTRYY